MAYFRKYAANRDYVNVVITSLDKPIIGRYIRIHPLEWHGHISFRFELYGWYSGFPTPEPPACMASLRLDSRKVPDSAITASSIANANYKASNGLLQAQPGNGGYRWIPSSQNNQEWFQVDFGSFEIVKIVYALPLGMESGKIPDSALVASSLGTVNIGDQSGQGYICKMKVTASVLEMIHYNSTESNGGGWISQFQDDKQFLQVDLGAVSKVTGSGLQGRADAGWWTKSFTLSYSNDGANFTPYDSGKVFQENTDNKTPAGHILETPIFARFLKININTFHGYPTLRVELYGCTRALTPATLYPKGFLKPATPQCMDALGMQFGNLPDSAITGSTSANANSFTPYVGRLHFLSAGSGKQGRWAAGSNDANQWFQVDFGSGTKLSAVATQGRQDSDQWVKSYSLSYSYDGVFYTTVDNENAQKKESRVGVVVRVLASHQYGPGSIPGPDTISGLSFSTPAPPQCMIPLGMQSQDIPDSAITASSSHNLNSFGPYLGRLHLLSSSGKHGSWAAAANNINQWFQVDFGSWTRVRAISRQGRQDAAQGIFKANSDQYTVVKNTLKEPIITRFIRIHPETWNGHISMRTEFYGCKKGFSPPNIVCVDPLGIENKQIPDSALKSSSDYNQYFGAQRSRLNEQREGSSGGWASKHADVGQLLQIDLGKTTEITRIATQGRSDANWWVTKYKLSYTRGERFEFYNNGEVFSGNFDQYTVVYHNLKYPIVIRYLRTKPKTWDGYIAIRAELYGCRQ
ncbi:uncharacterized protein, partial [Montipora capricornis]|uniref:uncharacterized protein n=1 Tax=Montipora capricornis TaxID=246305 RepID=UPI0035F1476E